MDFSFFILLFLNVFHLTLVRCVALPHIHSCCQQSVTCTITATNSGAQVAASVSSHLPPILDGRLLSHRRSYVDVALRFVCPAIQRRLTTVGNELYRVVLVCVSFWPTVVRAPFAVLCFRCRLCCAPAAQRICGNRQPTASQLVKWISFQFHFKRRVVFKCVVTRLFRFFELNFILNASVFNSIAHTCKHTLINF